MEGARTDEQAVASVAYRTVFLAAALLVLGLLFRELLTLLLAVLITVIVAIAGIFALIIPPFIDQTNQFVDDVPGIVEDLRNRIHDVTGADPSEIADSVRKFAQSYTDEPGRLIGPITSIGLSVAGILAWS